MPADLERAFDTALRHVQRSISSGMKTSGGSSARSQLETLEMELKRLELGISRYALRLRRRMLLVLLTPPVRGHAPRLVD